MFQDQLSNIEQHTAPKSFINNGFQYHPGTVNIEPEIVAQII